MRKATIALAALALSAAASVSAQAGIIVSSSVGGAPTGVTRENFDSLPLGVGSGGTTATGVSVATMPNAGIFQGSSSNIYAAPYLSGGNGLGFGAGGAMQADGPDATPYIAAGSTGTNPGAQVTISLPALEKYVGLLWGSVDDYNTLELFNGATLVGSLTGSQVLAMANGNQGPDGTVYVNIDASGDTSFDRLVLTSTQFTFEVDNLAFNSTAVPEPASMALLGSGLFGLGLLRRRKAQG